MAASLPIRCSSRECPSEVRKSPAAVSGIIVIVHLDQPQKELSRESVLLCICWRGQQGHVGHTCGRHMGQQARLSATGVLEQYKRRKGVTQSSRLYGKEIGQHEDGSVAATCRNTAEKVEPINFRSRVRRDDAMPAEIVQLCSVVGPIGWVARRCRPDSSYHVFRLQAVTRTAQVKDLIDANRVARHCAACADRGRQCPSGQFRWVGLTLVACSGASFAEEEETIARGQKKSRRSQRGRMFVFPRASPSPKDSFPCI